MIGGLMPFYVYILRCADETYYTGHSENLELRLAAHNSGEFEGYTQTRLPAELIFFEEFPTRYEALERERQLKGWSRAKKEALIAGDWNRIRRLARSRQNEGS